MIDASQLPRVPNEQLQTDRQRPVEYARAPAVSSGSAGPVRPAETERPER